MELNDILSLVKAGYTRHEIEQMEQQTQPEPDSASTPVVISEPAAQPIPQPVNEPQAKPVPVPAVKPAAAPADIPKPVYTPAPVPTSKPEEPSMSDILQSIARLTSAVQANAIAQSVIPGGVNAQPTAEDMLAEIIRPTFKERSSV